MSAIPSTVGMLGYVCQENYFLENPEPWCVFVDDPNYASTVYFSVWHKSG